MMIDSITTATAPQVKTEQPVQQLEQKRQQAEEQIQVDTNTNDIQPEELLSQIKVPSSWVSSPS